MKIDTFDPFKDFLVAGYLRNVRKDKDEATIKLFEHTLFRANLPDALQFLASRRTLAYNDFLQVHKILFSAYYPWAGQDRATTLPDNAVGKAGITFSHPHDAKRAVDEGLRLGQIPDVMKKKSGEVMGLFAYGHPFLDGNGRTMLLVHLELSYRAGFSIAWADTDKQNYLDALSHEINRPGRGLLDDYLLRFQGPRTERPDWGQSILVMKGLDGFDEGNRIAGDFADPAVVQSYRDFDAKRGYAYTAQHLMETASLSKEWGATPATGARGGTIKAVSDTEVIQHVGQGRHVVWPRTKLSGLPVDTGKYVEISGSGVVTEPERPAKSRVRSD